MKNLISIIFALVFTLLKAQNNNIPFCITKEDGNIILHWNTEKEVNSSYFIIENSSDNLNFTPIGRITAAGHSLINHDYELVYSNEKKIKNYIRVLLVTMDGMRESTLVLNQNYDTEENVVVGK